MENSYLGVITYNTDFDEFARLLGEMLEKSCPTDIKVIRYTGEKEYPGSKKLGYDRKIPFEEFVDEFKKREGEEKWKFLRKMDFKYTKEKIDPWIKEQRIRYNSKYIIDLHDTPQKTQWGKEIDNTINMELGYFVLNTKLTNLLDKYRNERLEPLQEKGVRIGSFMEMPILQTAGFHFIPIEVIYNLEDFAKDQTYVNDAAVVVRDLCEFLNENYI